MKLDTLRQLLNDLEKMDGDLEVRLAIPDRPELLPELKKQGWFGMLEGTHWAETEVVVVDRNDFSILK